LRRVRREEARHRGAPCRVPAPREDRGVVEAGRSLVIRPQRERARERTGREHTGGCRDDPAAPRSNRAGAKLRHDALDRRAPVGILVEPHHDRRVQTGRDAAFA
jgi:hypothetical protein